MFHTVKIKPLSANKLWQGRRFKTQEYKSYREELLCLLPNIEVPKTNIKLILEFGVSTPLADVDNLIKGFGDSLQDKYGFNDREITMIVATKKVVKKGDEYISFKIETNTY